MNILDSELSAESGLGKAAQSFHIWARQNVVWNFSYFDSEPFTGNILLYPLKPLKSQPLKSQNSEQIDLWFFLFELKGAPNADFLSSYEYFRIRHGSKWSPTKFESDYVIMGSTGVKLVKKWSLNFDKKLNTLRDIWPWTFWYEKTPILKLF